MTMVDFDGGQRAAPAKFSRGAIFASLFIVAVPAFTYVSVLLTDNIGSEPHRQIVDINAYPWSSIGKVGAAGQKMCTAAVIGPNQFLTAAHCLYMYSALEKRFMPPATIHFLLGYAKGEYRVHRVASRYMVPPTYVPLKIDAARGDWAVVYTDESLPPDIRPLRLATATPSAGTAVKIGGYPVERPHMMTADLHCQIRAMSVDGKLIAHDCVTHHGDSGGPLLSADDEGLILGVNVLGHSLLVELEEQSKEGGIAVSAASIAEFLASRGVSSIEGQKVTKLWVAP